MLEIINICSGSSGNSTIIKNDTTNILIDCGGLITDIKKALKNYCNNNIDALLITHNHNDHIKNLERFKDIKIYGKDLSVAHQKIDQHSKFYINDIIVESIPLSHDTTTLGYIITFKKYKIVYITDTGYLNKAVIQRIKDATHIIIEANYDVEMLMNSNRPLYLKQRILSDKGHLSNEDTYNILQEVISKKTIMVWLAHVSKECNDNELIKNNIIDKLNEINNIDYKILSHKEETIWK